MDAKVVWKGRMSFSGEAGTGFTLPLGTSPDVGGDNDGFKPLELLVVGLAGCTAMDVISILRKKRQDVRSFEVHVHADQADTHPRVFTHVRIDYIITGHNIDRAGVERALELSRTTYCPAQGMLGKVVQMDLHYTIHEA
jgi:putative redox protein